MASNDPTDTGGLFIGRRPGTAPVRWRDDVTATSKLRRRADDFLADCLLAVEILLCLSLLGPQPVAWLWVGSQVDYKTDNVGLGIAVAFAGMLTTLFATLMIARRLDHAWKLVRRAAGYEQKKGALEWIFVISLMIAGTAFMVWFLIIEGPGSQNFSGQLD